MKLSFNSQITSAIGAPLHRHDVAAANLPFHLETQPFEEALDRQIEARFQRSTSMRAASLRSTTNR